MKVKYYQFMGILMTTKTTKYVLLGILIVASIGIFSIGNEYAIAEKEKKINR